jgi:hypothetical protein
MELRSLGSGRRCWNVGDVGETIVVGLLGSTVGAICFLAVEGRKRRRLSQQPQYLSTRGQGVRSLSGSGSAPLDCFWKASWVLPYNDCGREHAPCKPPGVPS